MTPKVKNGVLHLYCKTQDGQAERLIECFYDHLGPGHGVVRRMIDQRDEEGFAIDGLAVPVEATELQDVINCLRIGGYTDQAIQCERLAEGQLIGELR